jgi:8-oxo-dGTP pyrophosphatase MutT (NUDIX family)
MLLTPDLLREAIATPAPAKALHFLIDTSHAKAAAVLVPVVLEPAPSVLVVLRGADLRDHAGEVGFPGGKPEPGDPDLRGTALREAHEEIAVDPGRVELVGELTPVPVITGRYLIHPFVGVIDGGEAPRAASSEIQRVLRLPLEPLLTGEMPTFAVVGTWRETEVFSPYFHVDGAVLYGASAYIFYELLAKLAARLGRALPAARIVDELPWGDRYAR